MDAERFTLEHPLVEEVEILIPDLLGIARGKRIPKHRLADLLAGRLSVSSTVYALDSLGENIEGSPLVHDEGDADRPLAPVAGSLRPAPWRPDRALALAAVVEPDGTPFWADPRAALARVVAELERRGLRACVAFEYEFYLLDPEPGPDGRPRPARSARHGGRAGLVEVYDLERLADVDGFLDLLGRFCEALELPLEAVSAEYAPGQFEVNLEHRGDPLRAADDAFLFRIAVRRAAREAGLRATFAAKPFTGRAGSGCHVHLSLYDAGGRNLFGEHPDGGRRLEAAVAGLLATAPAAMAVFAPNANSYRRLVPGSYAPVSACWGHNNRTVAVRIPPADPHARRIEHRIAGADSNPYLVLAAVLAGVLHGLEHDLEPPPPVSGDACRVPAAPLPCTWPEALSAFDREGVLSLRLGRRLVELYRLSRISEHERFRREVSDIDLAWYLPVL